MSARKKGTGDKAGPTLTPRPTPRPQGCDECGRRTPPHAHGPEEAVEPDERNARPHGAEGEVEEERRHAEPPHVDDVGRDVPAVRAPCVERVAPLHPELGLVERGEVEERLPYKHVERDLDRARGAQWARQTRRAP